MACYKEYKLKRNKMNIATKSFGGATLGHFT